MTILSQMLGAAGSGGGSFLLDSFFKDGATETTGAYVVPDGATYILVDGVGGGGGGAGSSRYTSGIKAGGAGGNGGACVRNLLIPVTPGETLNWYTGLGGTGGTAINQGTAGKGGAGADSKITKAAVELFVASGGQATEVAATTTNSTEQQSVATTLLGAWIIGGTERAIILNDQCMYGSAGGKGGTDITLLAGSAGAAAAFYTPGVYTPSGSFANGGGGAASYFGNGGRGAYSGSQEAYAGTGYGAGGGGGCGNNTDANHISRPGQAGSPGFIYVRVY